MPNYSRNEIVLVRFPFSDRTGAKVRPAIVVSSAHASHDLFLVPLTSKTLSLMAGEFILSDWNGAGLIVETAVKRGIFTIHEQLVSTAVGALTEGDVDELEVSLRFWLGL